MRFDSNDINLYVLPETIEEKSKLIHYLVEKNIGFNRVYSNGKIWHGRQYIDIPDGIHLKEELSKLEEVE